MGGPGLNTTDPDAVSIHGTNPQNLVEKILRMRIYDHAFWKEHCFALSAETLVDKAIELQYVGGTYGGNRTPTPFICLALKMLQIQPEKEIVIELIKNEEYKYVRALGAFYMRLVGKPVDIYQYLEPLYNDYRKLRYRNYEGFEITHMDEFVDKCIRDEHICDIALPSFPKRNVLEDNDLLAKRISVLDDEFNEINDAEDDVEISSAPAAAEQSAGPLEATAGGATGIDAEGPSKPPEGQQQEPGRSQDSGLTNGGGASSGRGGGARPRSRSRSPRGGDRSRGSGGGGGGSTRGSDRRRGGGRNRSRSRSRRPRRSRSRSRDRDRRRRSRSRSHDRRRHKRSRSRSRGRHRGRRRSPSRSRSSSSSSSSRSSRRSKGRRRRAEATKASATAEATKTDTAAKPPAKKARKEWTSAGVKKVRSDAGRDSKRSKQAAAGGGGAASASGSLEVDEANALRASLGLKPLRA
jgi:pre-mRNA-splicing factor 38A